MARGKERKNVRLREELRSAICFFVFVFLNMFLFVVVLLFITISVADVAT